MNRFFALLFLSLVTAGFCQDLPEVQKPKFKKYMVCFTNRTTHKCINVECNLFEVRDGKYFCYTEEFTKDHPDGVLVLTRKLWTGDYDCGTLEE